MAITTVFFDLDGTLLPMDQDAFVKHYFGLLAARLAPLGYEPGELIQTIWAGTAAMVQNDGSRLNEQAFWDTFTAKYGRDSLEHMPVFEDFYKTDFAGAKAACGFHPMAAATVKRLQRAGVGVVLATNPIFPAIATQNRIRWAGLEPEDFALYTTYENSRFCKPNPAYYQSILDALGLKAEECAMVGNDVAEDMVAAKLGMKVFLLTDCLLNKHNEDVSQYPHGSFQELNAFLDGILG